METEKGCCLVSQQIRDKITNEKILPSIADKKRSEEDTQGKKRGWFLNGLLEEQIQPSSYEPRVGNRLYILDIDTGKIFRPEAHETVKRTLLQLPRRQRQEINIENGFELKRGFSYLIPLEDKIMLEEKEHVISSPRSSRGRLFLNTRLLADYNPCINEIDGEYKKDTALNIWLLVQPTHHNIVLHPSETLNQLRFFKRNTDPRLTDDEIRNILEQKALFYTPDEKGDLIEARHFVRDGLQIHLDLKGRFTEGIVGLRARSNPNPIILKQKDYSPEEYFEPIVLKKEAITIGKGEYCLFASEEILEMPANLSAELKKYSDIGISGSVHDAGFVDNSFKGNVVFEVRAEELTRVELKHGMPVSKLKLFRALEDTDKPYGERIGSSYQNQFGPRPSSNFKPFNFNYAVRNYRKLDRLVLTQEKELLLKHRKTSEGFELIDESNKAKILEEVQTGFFHSRYDCEEDESVLQIIPYVILFNKEGKAFSYVRAENIQDYGESKLFGKHSIGVGGHIAHLDSPNYLQNCLEREVMKEEVEIKGTYSAPKLIGTLMSSEKPVDKVHFGLVYTIHTTGEIKPKESSLISGRMLGLNELESDSKINEKYETWSRLLVPHLRQIYARTL